MAVIDRDRWRVIEPLLDRALDLPDEERADWLTALRSTSPDLAAELAALLRGEDAADRRGFLAGALEPPAESARGLEGLQLGPWTLERPLGQGGMGSVWLARRADGQFEGRAAVKLLNLALLSEDGRERFRREGSLLARLAHPGIARLLDAGVGARGQPYLVLEHVDGTPIDAFVEQRKLPVDARLRLVLQVLSAVEHAHQNLVVHRDLKPSNILVTADGAAKLLDFGIAKLLEPDGAAPRTALTVEGIRALTPAFAAPEQILGDPITTATDVHGVGVLLYLLLTGRRPFGNDGQSAASVERLICETDPVPPSAAAPGLGADVDAIILKALSKQPARRYPSAAALADDIERLLDGRPVRARRPSAAYRLRKFVGRNRGGVALAAVALVALAGAGARERTLRARAEAEARKARAVEEYLVSVFDVADPFAPPSRKPEDVTARALLDRGAARVDSTLAGQPEVQAELRGVFGHVYKNLGLFDRSVPLLERALEQRRALHGPRHPAVAGAMSELGEALVGLNQYDRAEPLLRDALAQRRALLGNRHVETAESADHLATLLQEKSQYAAAESLFREAVEIRRAAEGPDREGVAHALNNLGLVLFARGQYDAAEPHYRQALAIYVARLGEDHPHTAQALHNLAQTQQLRGKTAEADTLYRRALAAKRKSLGDAHPSVTVNLNNLGAMLMREPGRLDEAEAFIREALALDRQIFGARHGYVAASLNNLGGVLRAKGELDEAERVTREALEINRALHGAEHASIALNLNALGVTRLTRGDAEGAVPVLERSVGMYGRLVGEKHRSHAAVSLNLGKALRESGRTFEAESVFRATAARLDTTNAGSRGFYIGLRTGLGQALTDRGRADEALPVLEHAVAMARKQYPAGDWRTGEPLLALGEAHLALRDRARAEPLLRDAVTALESQRRAQPRLVARASTSLARARR